MTITPDLEPDDRTELLRLAEAVLFAAAEPLDTASITAQLPEGADVPVLIEDLRKLYAGRGVNLVQIGGKWALRTAPDLADRLRIERESQRKLSRAANETLAIVAYHQPVTRGEIEEIRGVALSKGTLDLLLEIGWVKPGRRRNAPGRPLTWLTTEAFLSHFGLESLKDLPGVQELKAAGLLDTRPASSVYAERADQEDLPFGAITGEGEDGDLAGEPLETGEGDESEEAGDFTEEEAAPEGGPDGEPEDGEPQEGEPEEPAAEKDAAQDDAAEEDGAEESEAGDGERRAYEDLNSA